MAGKSISNVRRFIILLSGEGFTFFSINNRTFLVKKSKMMLSGVPFFFKHAQKL